MRKEEEEEEGRAPKADTTRLVEGSKVENDIFRLSWIDNLESWSNDFSL